MPERTLADLLEKAGPRPWRWVLSPKTGLIRIEDANGNPVTRGVCIFDDEGAPVAHACVEIGNADLIISAINSLP